MPTKYISTDYYFHFQTGKVHFLLADMFAHYYSDFDGVMLSGKDQYSDYIHKSGIAETERVYKDFYKDNDSLRQIGDTFDRAEKELLDQQSAIATTEKITSADFESFITSAAAILDAYAAFDHIFTDHLFKDKREDIEGLVRVATEKKNVLRERIDPILFGDGTFVALVRKIASQYGVPEDRIFAASIDEVRELLAFGKMPERDIRNSDYVVVRDHDTYTYYFGDEATAFIAGFIVEEHHGEVGELKGVSVSKKGVYTGTVRKTSVDYTNLKGSIAEFEHIPAGMILVTEMTVPEMVSLMARSKAIVTDIGGMLCHAAITSRELGIPCIIGTKLATKILQDGDEVEVDADKGIVTILTQ
ncbi:hypothetical protein HY416_03790 [Candidatus Kaiserbacteria bacterium]|nr:hypothetical protein [Candidatus Kaiserbacteria bacterium]